MAKPSSIDRLPPDILEQLQTLLRDPRVTQLEATRQINAILERDGHPERVSKSAVNRYSQRMEEVGARLRQSREMAAMWIGKLGAAPQGEVGKLLNEMIRTLAFEATMSAAESEEPVPPSVINKLALAVQRLEAASSINEKREAEIRARAREEAAAKLEEKVGETTGAIPAERLREIIREAYGA